MKTEKIEIRTTKEFKNRVRRAAERDNKTVSQYMTDSVLMLLSHKPDNVREKQTRQ
jgi:uncharacterized protein (DUF1778 family)